VLKVIALFVLVAAAPLSSQSERAEPTLQVVLKRTAAYVAEYQTRLADIVAEEDYGQSVAHPGGSRTTTVRLHRELKSDLLLVRKPSFPADTATGDPGLGRR
jgi:hypothetical protein